MERNIDIGAGLMLPVDFDRLHNHRASIEHIENIGARNVLMDCHAPIKRDDFETDQEWRNAKLLKAQSKLEQLYDGSIRANSSGPRASSIDPIAAEALREARVFVHSKAKGWEKATDSAINWLTTIADKLGIELAEENPDWKAVIAAAVKFRAEKPESIATATKIVEARKAIAVDVDL